MSFYQSIKPVILELFNLSKDAIHIHIGFACLIIVLLISKKKLSSFYVILPGFILSLLMEVLDLHDDYTYLRELRFGASLHDIINTNFIPVVLVLLAKFRRLKTN